MFCTVPPYHHATKRRFAGGAGHNPHSFLADVHRQQLIQAGRFQAVGQEALRLQLPQKLLHRAARRDDDDDRLQRIRLVLRARHQVHAPNDVRDGQGRELFHLQLHHLRNSAASLAGNWTARRKTLSGGSQAMLSLPRKRVCQSLPTRPEGQRIVGQQAFSDWTVNLSPLAESCQRRRPAALE
jgi:hypothetical protein